MAVGAHPLGQFPPTQLQSPPQLVVLNLCSQQWQARQWTARIDLNICERFTAWVLRGSALDGFVTRAGNTGTTSLHALGYVIVREYC